ncbi:MAG: family N-acetyltransferase [Cyanobacteria bacterium RYN_339]|nr:family N-acetyltransferase [Cyanobacteria bacterium RYN_339]
MKLRIPGIEDLDEILALINDPESPHRQEACRHREAPENPKELYARLDEDFNVVVELAGEIAGFASWQVWDTHAHLNVLSVSGRHQRQGVGRALFNAFRDRAREHGVFSYTLRAFADSTWATRFYASLGLQPLTPEQLQAPHHPGLQLYVALAISQRQWPAPEKVMFFETL